MCCSQLLFFKNPPPPHFQGDFCLFFLHPFYVIHTSLLSIWFFLNLDLSVYILHTVLFKYFSGGFELEPLVGSTADILDDEVGEEKIREETWDKGDKTQLRYVVISVWWLLSILPKQWSDYFIVMYF